MKPDEIDQSLIHVSFGFKEDGEDAFSVEVGYLLSADKRPDTTDLVYHTDIWGRLMQSQMEAGSHLADIWVKAAYDAGVSPRLYPRALILMRHWLHGDELMELAFAPHVRQILTNAADRRLKAEIELKRAS